MKKLKKISEILNGFNAMPNDKIEINSLSLLSLVKHSKRLKIKIKGIIIAIRFGIK
tara:strand:+ start:316 stop:483 length:168 start_codon:yes stop_codon:yes gene_type:complete